MQFNTNYSEKMYNVKLIDGQIIEIRCEPTKIKKEIGKHCNLPFENIILIRIKTNRMYSAIQIDDDFIDLSVVDINSLLSQNLDLQKQLYEVGNGLKGQNLNEFNKNQDQDQNQEPQIQNYALQIQQIQQSRQKLFQENDDLFRKNTQLAKINALNEQNLKDNSNVILDKQKQIDQYQAYVNKLQQELKNLQSNNNLLESIIAEKKKEINTLSDVKSQILSELDAAQQNQKVQEKKEKELLNNIRNLQQQLQNQENDFKLQLELLDQQNNRNIPNRIPVDYRALQNELDEANQNLEEISQQYDNLQRNHQQEVLLMKNKFSNEISGLKIEINNQNSYIEHLKLEILQVHDRMEAQQNIHDNEIQEQNKKQNSLKKTIDELTDELTQLQLTVNTLKLENSDLTDQNESQESEIKKLKGINSNLKIQQEDLEEGFNLIRNQLYLQINERNQQLMEKTEEALLFKNQSEKLQQKVVRLSEILKRMSNKNLGSGLSQVTSPIRKLLNSTHGVSKFQENPNFQSDETDYQVYKIKATDEFIKSIQKGKFSDLQQYLESELIGQINTIRSLQPNEEGDLMKVYVMEVKNTNIASLQNKFLIRKDLSKIKNQNYNNLNHAAALSINNIFTQTLLDLFVKDLKSLNMITLNFQIAPQYVIKQKGDEIYYYCEEIIEGNFQQINGGELELGTSQKNQFLNSFVKYSHKLCQEELFITYINVVNQYLYDMIVTTEFGYFSEIDQGKDEFIRAQEINDLTEQYFGQFYNNQLEMKAKQFIS